MAGTVLITGAARGIGRGIALAFAEAGWRVVANDIGPADETRTLLGSRGAYLQGDIAAPEHHAALVDQAFDAFGSLDALINNAGISVTRRGDMLDVTPDSFDRVLGTNLRGTFFLTQAVARRWALEPPRPRTIVTISSVNATHASPDRAEYCLAKASLSMMTKLFAARLAELGIGVFEIRPGIIRTDMTAVAAPKYDRLIEQGVSPICRWGEPADIGAACVALAGDGFRFSTGEVVHVDGGLHIQRL